MMIFILAWALLSSPAQADDLLNVLDGDQSQIDGLNFEKKSHIFQGLVKQPTAEQTIFFQFLEKAEARKALYQWPSAFGGTAFETSANGRALYAYLLFKNNLKIMGLESLFAVNPERLNKKLIGLWRGLMQTEESLWSHTQVQWSQPWTEVFGISAEVMVLARNFDKTFEGPQLEGLLRRTNSGTWERSWVEWQLVIHLLLKDDIIKAAKLLKHLQGVKKANPISQDLMNLTAARMLYQKGYLSQAIRYYQKIPKSSDYWFESIEEQAWAELRLGKPQNTLALTQSLLVDDFQSDVGPEPLYLTSLANLKVCDYQQVSKTLLTFKSRFKKKATELLTLKKSPESKDVQKLFGLLDSGEAKTLALGAAAVKLPRFATRDEVLKSMVRRHVIMLSEAEVAKKLYSQSLTEGTAQVGFQGAMETFRQQIEQRARTSYTASLNRVRHLADQEIAEISDNLKKMQIVEAELIQQLAMADRLLEDTKGQKKNIRQGSTAKTTQDSLSFPFNGEIWFDEIGHYQMNVAGGCQNNQKGKSL